MRLFFRRKPKEPVPVKQTEQQGYQLIPTVTVGAIEREEDNAPVAYFGELGSGDSCTPEEALEQSFEARMETLGYTKFDTGSAEIKDLDLSRLDDLMSRLTN